MQTDRNGATYSGQWRDNKRAGQGSMSYDKSIVASPSSSPITSQPQQNSDLVTPAFSPASSSGSGGSLQAQHAQQLSSSSSLRSLAPKGLFVPTSPGASLRSSSSTSSPRPSSPLTAGSGGGSGASRARAIQASSPSLRPSSPSFTARLSGLGSRGR